MFFKSNKSIADNYVGGIEKKVIDKAYRESNKSLKSASFSALSKDTIVETLRLGLDINAYNNSDGPMVFRVNDQETLDIFEYLGVNSSVSEYLKRIMIYKMSPFMFKKKWDEIKDIVYKSKGFDNSINTVRNFEIIDILLEKGINFDSLSSYDEYFYTFNSIYNYITGYITLDEYKKFIEKVKPNLNRIVDETFINLKFKVHIKYYYFLRLFNGYYTMNITNDKIKRFEEIFGPLNINEPFYEDFDLFFLIEPLFSDKRMRLVKYLIKNGVNPCRVNKHGFSFFDVLTQNPKKYKTIYSYISKQIDNDSFINSEATDFLRNSAGNITETSSNEKYSDKSSTSKINEVKEKINALKSFSFSDYKKREPNSSLPTGYDLLQLISQNIFIIDDDHIIYDGVHHMISKLTINNKKARLYPNIENNKEGYMKLMLDFCKYVESNPKLIIATKKMSKEFNKLKKNHNLTGSLILKLISDNLLTISKSKQEDENNFLILETLSYVQDIPYYQNYIQEFIQTLIDYNPVFNGNISVQFVHVTTTNSHDVKHKEKSRLSNKRASLSSSQIDPILYALLQDKELNKFKNLVKELDLDSIIVANNINLLHLSCLYKLDDFSMYLINNGINIHTQTTSEVVGPDNLIHSEGVKGITPLHLAVQNQSESVVEVLLNKGANPNSLNEYQLSPLMKAAQKNNTKIIQLLLDFNANIEERNVEGKTPLWLAAKSNSTEAAKLLIDSGAKVRIENDEFIAPIGLAVANGNIEMIKYMLSHGADFEYEKKVAGLGFGSFLVDAIWNQKSTRKLLELLDANDYPLLAYRQGFHIILSMAMKKYPQSDIDYFAKKVNFDISNMDIHLSGELQTDEFKAIFIENIVNKNFDELKKYLLTTKIKVVDYNLLKDTIKYFIEKYKREQKERANDFNLDNIKSLLDFYNFIGSTVDIRNSSTGSSILLEFIVDLETVKPNDTVLYLKVIETLLEAGGNPNISKAEITPMDVALSLSNKQLSDDVLKILRKYNAKTFNEFYRNS